MAYAGEVHIPRIECATCSTTWSFIANHQRKQVDTVLHYTLTIHYTLTVYSLYTHCTLTVHSLYTHHRWPIQRNILHGAQRSRGLGKVLAQGQEEKESGLAQELDQAQESEELGLQGRTGKIRGQSPHCTFRYTMR
jgi:hypothetical protein